MEVYSKLDLPMDTFYKTVWCLIMDLEVMNNIFTWCLDDEWHWKVFKNGFLCGDKNAVIIILFYKLTFQS